MVNSFDYAYSYDVLAIGSKLNDFLFLNEIGRGSFGVVNKVKSLLDNKIYAIKKLNLKNMKEDSQREAIEEVIILKKLDHPHIIKYYTSFFEQECLYIVMDFGEGGDLNSKIREHRFKRETIKEDLLWKYAYEIFLGIHYLHCNNVIHRDIKCLNIFIKKNMIKIGDLGVSKIVHNLELLSPSKVGTPTYSSPELINQTNYDYKVDIWAIGCTLYHLANLDLPFLGNDREILRERITNHKHKYLSDYSLKFNELIDKCLSKMPDDRISAKEALDLYFPLSIKQAYKDKIKKIEDFEKIKDKFDYDKVFSSILENNFIPKKICEKTIENNDIFIMKHDNKFLKSSKMNDVSSANLENKINLTPLIIREKPKRICEFDEILMSKTVQNSFKGLQKFKENKIKRQIMVNNLSGFSIKVKTSRESLLCDNESKYAAENGLNINLEKKEIDPYCMNSISSHNDVKFVQNNLFSNVNRPFTAEDNHFGININANKNIQTPEIQSNKPLNIMCNVGFNETNRKNVIQCKNIVNRNKMHLNTSDKNINYYSASLLYNVPQKKLISSESIRESNLNLDQGFYQENQSFFIQKNRINNSDKDFIFKKLVKNIEGNSKRLTIYDFK